MRINWFNYLFLPIDGYGRYGLHFVRALSRLGVDVYPATVETVDAPGWFQRLQGLDFSKLSISLMPPHHLRSVPGRQWNYSMYEGTGLPDGWARHVMDKAERVIVPAAWLVDVFREHGVTHPIDVVPGGIDPEEFPVVPPPKWDRPYTFLALGDRGSRKGMDTVWQAFYAAFGKRPDVRLIVKSRAGGLTYVDMTNSDRRVSIWRSDVDSMADVYAQVDCFVFPTKGEGYGLPPREAAAMGVPVICTQWSGVDDCDQWAIPIKDYKMVESALDGGGQWALPSVEETAMHMQWCFDHREEARQIGLKGAAWLRANATWQHAACKLFKLLEAHSSWQA